VRLIVLAVVVGLAAPARAEEEVRPTFAGLEAGPNPVETYKLNAFGIIRHEVSGSWSWLFGSTSWWRPVRGKFRYATRYEDFYRALGRPDLAEQHENRRIVSNVLYYGGAATFVGGGVLLFTKLDISATRAKVGLGMLAGGMVAYLVGGAIQPPLVSEEDAAAMTAEYNRRLRLHLGVTVDDHAAVGLTLRGPW
jgi:hypothetical protein